MRWDKDPWRLKNRTGAMLHMDERPLWIDVEGVGSMVRDLFGESAIPIAEHDSTKVGAFQYGYCGGVGMGGFVRHKFFLCSWAGSGDLQDDQGSARYDIEKGAGCDECDMSYGRLDSVGVEAYKGCDEP